MFKRVRASQSSVCEYSIVASSSHKQFAIQNGKSTFARESTAVWVITRYRLYFLEYSQYYEVIDLSEAIKRFELRQETRTKLTERTC